MKRRATKRTNTREQRWSNDTHGNQSLLRQKQKHMRCRKQEASAQIPSCH